MVRTLLQICIFIFICAEGPMADGWIIPEARSFNSRGHFSTRLCGSNADGTDYEYPCSDPTSVSRRRVLDRAVAGSIPLLFSSMSSYEAVANDKEGFVSAGFVRSEYTNSITASRDTNISPKEVYDSILALREHQDGSTALDVGAGAGVSTQTLYQMGYTNIDALDWSCDAWNINVVENGHCPDSVHFYNLDDERFLKLWRKSITRKYDVIVFNFAVNSDKATQFATELLTRDGLLLAPVNNQKDYWLKQSFQVLNAQGKVLSSTSDVGAWSVLFQPDVTQDTCQGIWCAPFNGFQKQ